MYSCGKRAFPVQAKAVVLARSNVADFGLPAQFVDNPVIERGRRRTALLENGLSVYEDACADSLICHLIPDENGADKRSGVRNLEC